MDDETADAVRAQLDAQLQQADPNVGILFGRAVFEAFRERGWIELAVFGVLGTAFAATRFPAYGTHFAMLTWDLPDQEFSVGQPAA
jgi:hypothetical protein